MSYKIIITKAAEDALIKEYVYYHDINPLLAERLEHEFERLIDLLQKYPFIFSVRYKNVHFAVMKNFRYTVHYVVKRKTVFVIGVFHTARNPDTWSK